ncbi:CoA biosynthesis protein CoaBC OS=Lysinibacillus sphaericus OX=1421 GN=LS41612_18110 PE=4 SV=1 [Lysinibacillus sphaericus]
MQQYFFAPKPLAGRTVLVTAGASYVPMDNQHVISTKADGKVGQALARSASTGAHVFF